MLEPIYDLFEFEAPSHLSACRRAMVVQTAIIDFFVLSA